MLSWRWGGAVFLTALGAALAFVWAGGGGQSDDVDEAPVPVTIEGFSLVGFLEAFGVDPRKC